MTVELLIKLSYKSNLGIKLKKNLHYFDKEELLSKLEKINEWYDLCDFLHDITIDYRIKSIQSARLKYDRYYSGHQIGKVFNDMLGFRTLCDNYDDVLGLAENENIRVADMSKGKANDDGYRGVHVYFQLDNFHYPIEIQYNTYYDRQINNWLHKYVYKKKYDDGVGQYLRQAYENARIKMKMNLRRC